MPTRISTKPEIPLAKILQLYLAIAHKGNGSYEPHERQATVQLSQQWAPDYDRAEIEAMVDTAYAAVRSGFGQGIEAIAEELSGQLPSELRTRLVRDLGLIARADGHLTLREARLIGSLRSALGHPADHAPEYHS